jgi:uncharacterized protein YodC (DUF2158 family)
MQFKVGDTVQLKSGGPIMTIIEVLSEGWVTCRWYDGKQYKTENFPSEALVNEESGIGVA